MRFKTFLEVYGSSFNYKVPSDKETLLYDFYMIYNLSGISDSLTDKVGKMRRSGLDVPPGADKWSKGGDPDTTPEDKIDYTIKEVRSKILPKLKQDLLEAVFFSICAESRHIFDNNSPQRVLQVVEDKFGAEGKDLVRRYSKYYFQQQNSHIAALSRPINDIPSRQVNKDKDQDAYVQSFKAATKATGSDIVDKFTTNEEQAKFVKIFQYLFFATDDESISNYRKNKSIGKSAKPSTQAAWSSMYGGLPWADIARGWLELLRANTENQMMVQIDHVYDLQHNTSTVFNKLNSYAKSGGHGWVKNALDFKAHIKEPHELVKRVSPAMRKLSLMALKIKTGRTLEDYEKDKNKPASAKTPGSSSNVESPVDPNLTPEQQKLKELYTSVYTMGSSHGFSTARTIARTMIIAQETPGKIRITKSDDAYKIAKEVLGANESHLSKFDSFFTAEQQNMVALQELEGTDINGVSKEQANNIFGKLNLTTAFRPSEITAIKQHAEKLINADTTNLNSHAIDLLKFIKNQVSPYTLSVGMLYAKAFLLTAWGAKGFPPLDKPAFSQDLIDAADQIQEFMQEVGINTSTAIARFAFNRKLKPKELKEICNYFWGNLSMLPQIQGVIASFTKNSILMKGKNYQYEGEHIDNVFNGEEEANIKNLLKSNHSVADQYSNVDAYIRTILNLKKDGEGINVSQFYRKWLVNKIMLIVSVPEPSISNKYTSDLMASAKTIAKFIVGKPQDIIGRLMVSTGLNFETIVKGVYGGNKDLSPIKTIAEFYSKQELKNIQLLKHFEPTMVNALKNKNGYQEIINSMKEQGFKLQLPMEVTSKVINLPRFQKALGYSTLITNLYKTYIEMLNENFNNLL